MKKTILTMSIAIGILSFSSCNKEVIEPKAPAINAENVQLKINGDGNEVVSGKWDGDMNSTEICCDPGTVCYIIVRPSMADYERDLNNPDGDENMNVAIDRDGNVGKTIYGRVTNVSQNGSKTIYRFN